MSVFVDENETFPIVLYVKNVKSEEGFLLNVEVSDQEQSGEEWEKIRANFCQPSSFSMNSILERSTVLNSLNQRPVIQTGLLRDGIILMFLRKFEIWNPEEEDWVISPLNEMSIQKMHFNLSNELFLQYIYNVKLDIYLEAIINNDSEIDNNRRF